MMTLTIARHVALRTAVAMAMSLAVLVSTGAAPVCAQDYASIIAQADRTEADRSARSVLRMSDAISNVLQTQLES
jgi:hypothetical protein